MPVRTLLFGLLLSLAALPAFAATVTHAVATTDTTNDPNTSDAFTPATDDLLVVGVCFAGTNDATPTLTSSVGGKTFTLFSTIGYGSSSIHRLYLFVADQLASNTSQTVTATAPNDTGTGTIIMVERVAGVTRTGTNAIRQTATDPDKGAAATPSVTFAGAALTGNPTIAFLCNTQVTTASVTPPTNWTEQADVGHATPDNGGEVATRNSGFTGTTVTWNSTYGANGGAAVTEIDTSASGVAVNFTSGPSVSAAANGYTISGTLNGSGFGTLTAYAVGVAPGDGAPTCTQIKAGQNDGGSAAILAANEAWTTDVGDSFSLATASKPASMDVHVCASDGTNNTSVTSASDQLRSARSGFALVTMASVSATGICDHDSYFNPDCAIGDVFEYETVTNESADCAVSISTGGDVTLTPTAAGDCDGRQTFEISYEDVSSATDGLFTAPTVGNFSTDDTAYINNSAPACAAEPGSIVLLAYNSAMSAQDLALLGQCTDADSDVITYSITTGTLPTGTSLSGTGNKDWTGTPTVENEAGTAITVTATDVPGDTDTFDFTVYVVDTWTVPDLSGLSVGDAGTAILADAPWRAADPGPDVAGFTCDAGAENLVVSQDPAASAEAAAEDPISVYLSILCPSSTYAGERKVVYELSDVSGMTRWVDYIPVVVQVGCNAGSYDEDGCWPVTALSSTSGKVAWVDYIPVYAVQETVNKWRYENNGWIPVDTLTP